MIDEKKLIEIFEERMKDDNVMSPIIKVVDVLEIIAEQPKADWIPCEERLPSETGMYLGTYVYGGAKIVDILFFGGKTFYYPDDMLGVSAKFIEVIAWQPIQPYKKEGAE